MTRLILAAAATLALGAPLTTSAAVITYETPDNTLVDSLPVAATATFTTSNGDILVELLNSIVDPTSVAQNISGIGFTVGDATAGSLTTSSGAQRTIAGNGSFTDGAIGSTDWLFSFGGGGIFNLTALGASGPDQTIVGAPNASGLYGSANGSIAANAPHNPFLGETASFSLSGVGVTELSTITNVVLFFGTGSVPVPLAECSDGCGPTATVPEPMSLLLLGSGLIGLTWSVRNRARVR
jgi:PEP-CTERM motif-containing protein